MAMFWDKIERNGKQITRVRNYTGKVVSMFIQVDKGKFQPVDEVGNPLTEQVFPSTSEAITYSERHQDTWGKAEAC